jgi:hypothetical protein
MKRTIYTGSQHIDGTHQPAANRTEVSHSLYVTPLQTTATENMQFRLSQVWEEERIQVEAQKQQRVAEERLEKERQQQKTRYSFD